jgi:putative addiction module killer protein
MAAEQYLVREYVARNGTRPFADWLWSLDWSVAARVKTRLARLRLGNFGDARPLGGRLQELRIDAGPGYRIYLVVDGGSIVVLLGGGDKATQQRDIRRARERLEDYLGRSDA